jgi:hypothetical protein
MENTQEREKHYWGYRIDVKNQDFFFKELEQGRLRQGWGYDKNQELPDTKDSGAKKNLSMYKNVKKGDILLIPRLPKWSDVAIAEATEDWDKGYKFEIDGEKEDFGHIFPVTYIGWFNRNGKDVSGEIKSTLKARNRFWNITRFSKNIKKIIQNLENNQTFISVNESIENIVSEEMDTYFKSLNEFSEKIYKKYNDKFEATDWEKVLKNVLEKIYPSEYIVENTGGIKEKKHGTDISITIPGIFENYMIAIQIKNYKYVVNNIDKIIEQINKSEEYEWSNNRKLIDKILIITSAKRKDNQNLVEKCQEKSIKVIFSEELKKLIFISNIKSIGLKEIFEEIL